MRALRTLAALSLILAACDNSADSDTDSTGGQGSAGAPVAGTPGTAGKAGSSAGMTPAGGSAGTTTSGASGQGGIAAGASAGAGGATGGTAGSAGAGSSGAGAGSSGTNAGGRGGTSASAGGSGMIGGAGTGSGGSSAGGSGSAGKAGGGSAGSGGNLTLWLAGDSTMANGETPCPVGWGKVFDPLFDDRVTVTNSAVGGRSIRTWLYSVQKTMDASGECVRDLDQNGDPVLQARWTTMLNGMKKGDYLFIQFGINDGDPSCDRHVGLDAFKEGLGMMAQAAKDRGTNPVFITPVSAISCQGSTAQGTRGGFVTTTIDAGKAFDVPVIDLHALSVALYTSLGFCPVPGGDVSSTTTGPVGDFFCDDHTHFDTPGAQQIAKLVAGAIEDQGLGLATYLK